MKVFSYLIGLFLVSVVLSIFTYTLTDLNLTLASNSFVIDFQSKLQSLGFYNREINSLIFFLAFSLLIFLYLLFDKKNFLPLKHKKVAVIVFVAPFLFSYPAFVSYDIFNYIFDSKIITYYHLNPYQFSALNFPDDPMLHFMRWTHRTYPYGPLWLLPGIVITIISSKLLIQFFLFKLVAIKAAILTAYFISPKPKFRSLSLLLNPLVVIEVLISAHNDIYIALFTILAIKFISHIHTSIPMLFLGGLIKFANFFLIPAFIFFRKPTQNFYLFALSLTLLAIFLASLRTEFQTWYIIWALPFAYLLNKGNFLRNFILIASLILPLSYIPYIYTGSYDGLSFYLKYILLITCLPITFILMRVRSKSL